MFTTSEELKGLAVLAIDGELGTVHDLYFDDVTWAIRYLTLETGGWLSERKVLISPMSVRYIDWEARRIEVSLTKKQVEDSPSIDTHKPVSRQHEAQYMGYYGYPFYWEGPYMWGPIESPAGILTPSMIAQHDLAELVRKEPSDSHLRSTRDVSGYHISATDGEIGHLSHFIVDCEDWAIRYLEVATKNWWPGKKVLLSPAWVDRVSWEDSKVYVTLSRDVIQNGPEYVDGLAITREYEQLLYSHYGRPPYWRGGSNSASVLALTV